MVLIIAGQGVLITKNPSSLSETDFPFSSKMSIIKPGKGKVPEPGFKGIPGIGVIMNIPVSVCHHVSIIGHFSFPITL